MGFKSDPLKLVKSFKVQNDKGQWENVKNELTTDDLYIYLQHRRLKNPNISSHVMVDLMGENPYMTPGKALIQAFGLLEYSPIDPYYTHRGGVIEVLAEAYLREVLYPSYKLVIENYELADFPGYNQFPNEKPFSGVLDKAIVQPFRLPLEIKSKEMKDYSWIVGKGKYPEAEVTQGQHLADLWKASQVMMLWGFIDTKLQTYLKGVTEAGIFETFTKMHYGERRIDYDKAVQELGLTYKDVTWEFKIYDVDHAKLKKYRDFSIEIYDQVINERRISRKWFNHSELEDIDKFIKGL